MKYTTSNLLIQIANRITNSIGKISKTVLGSMLSDMADSSVKLIGDETIAGVKTFTSPIVLPSIEPSGMQAVAKEYLELRLRESFSKKIVELETGIITSGEVNVLDFDFDGNENTYIESVMVYTLEDNTSSAVLSYDFQIRIIEKFDRETIGLDVLAVESGIVKTVLLENEQSNSKELEVFSVTGFLINEMIFVDNNSEMSSATIADISGRILQLNEATSILYAHNSHIRSLNKLNYKGLININDRLAFEVKNNSLTDCRFGIIIKYANI
jgi:hypothetical protein